MNDETLFNGFKLFLEEQKAIAIINGELSEEEAEILTTAPENIRRTVLSL